MKKQPAKKLIKGVGVKAPVKKALDIQVGGNHYQNFAVQPAEYCIKNGLPFAEGVIIKYVSRWKLKNGVEDLKKAKHYIEMLIAHEEGNLV